MEKAVTLKDYLIYVRKGASKKCSGGPATPSGNTQPTMLQGPKSVELVKFCGQIQLRGSF